MESIFSTGAAESIKRPLDSSFQDSQAFSESLLWLCLCV